ncbi:hypothetical protein [Alicyclobacillus fastidiosus]|uniref:hypothetical protein n=1 Tax=Alicyclobacillus fastidiosus TaxID=392011 RepID=UPI0023E9C72F|nr:hypothetical protein [Alicyclobacillus fastidiosus]GMA61173.1 hypothetical protein GCM10025859_16130 [Alicyclobacillus fastidiosus]
MRIAWIGPMPNETGGATGVATQLLLELANYDIEIDCFFPGSPSALPASLTDLSNVHFYFQASSWEWDRWYSRNGLMCFITGQIANYRSEDRLAKRLLALHEERPYDLVYQFSHIELSILRKFIKQLPLSYCTHLCTRLANSGGIDGNRLSRDRRNRGFDAWVRASC